MNINVYRNSINEAKKRLKSTNDKAHDLLHAKRVSENTKLICSLVGNKEEAILDLSAWWHDVGRIYQSDHEELSGQLVFDDLKARGLDEKTCRRVYEIIRFHKWSMKPTSLEGNILRDADKLDFISINRWEACIEANQLKHIQDIKILLPRLSDFLYLEVSKQIYNKRIIEFNNYLKTKKI